MNEKILIVEDEFVEARHIELTLENAGYRIAGIARSVNAALEMLDQERPDLVLLDIFLKGSLTGIHLGQMLKERGSAFIYLSANSNRDTLEMAKATGPYGFLVKPFREKDVLVMLEIAIYHDHVRKLSLPRKAVTNAKARAATPEPKGNNFNGIVGESQKLQSVITNLQIVAPTDVSVLILGETGTGKERIVDTLHRLSPRSKGPLIKVNCAALPSTLIESILFGHERGAFTGATEKRRGKFEQANGGTIFLDEIGELGTDIQVKLLRVLQEKEVELLGGEEVIKVDCRIVAATNRDLAVEVERGHFRMDLYYRLNVFPLLLPPLRERKEDIPALANHFVNYYSKKLGKPVPNLSPAVVKELHEYHWPGNIRELEHTMERAVLLAQGDSIDRVSISHSLAAILTPDPNVCISSIDEIERDHIIDVLRRCDGKVAGKGGAAEILKMHSSTLNSRIKKLGIKKQRNVI
jgi:two-component system, NtrC family, response regulator HydG